jgi:ABC-type sugar transport system substrate-binding protein
MRGLKIVLAVAATTAVVVGSAACSDSGSGGGDGTKTIGVVQPASSSELLARQASALELGGKALGWDMQIATGETTPQRWASDIQGFISKRVDAIIIIGFDPSTVAPQLKSARDADIPVIQTVVSIDGDSASLVDAHYDLDYAAMGDAIGEYAVKTLPNATVVAQDVTITPAVQAFNDGADEVIKAAGDPGIVGRADLNVAEPVVQAHGKNLLNLLNAHPNANAYLAGGDNSLTSISSTTAQVQKPLLYLGSFQNPSTLKLIESGMNAAVVAVNQDRTAFEALDALAANFENGTEIPATYPNDKQEMTIVDQGNISQGDPYPTDKEAAVWLDKWKSEYGTA